MQNFFRNLTLQFYNISYIHTNNHNATNQTKEKMSPKIYKKNHCTKTHLNPRCVCEIILFRCLICGNLFFLFCFCSCSIFYLRFMCDAFNTMGRVDKLDTSFSRSRSSSMSSLENISTESVTCLAFADSYTKKSGKYTHLYIAYIQSIGRLFVWHRLCV